MKKCRLLFLLILLLSLCGCSMIPNILSESRIETLKSWSFQYNSGTDDYSLFFALCDESDKYLSADVDVDIRIIDDNDNLLYGGTKSVLKSDFGYYSSKNDGEQFLANVRIKSSEIKEGTSVSGKVFLKVYKNDVVRFDEVNCTALFCLPIKDVSVVVEELPIEISVKGYDGKVESKIKIEEVSYSFDKSLMTQLKITIMGTKTFGRSIGFLLSSVKTETALGCRFDAGHGLLIGVTDICEEAALIDCSDLFEQCNGFLRHSSEPDAYRDVGRKRFLGPTRNRCDNRRSAEMVPDIILNDDAGANAELLASHAGIEIGKEDVSAFDFRFFHSTFLPV